MRISPGRNHDGLLDYWTGKADGVRRGDGKEEGVRLQLTSNVQLNGIFEDCRRQEIVLNAASEARVVVVSRRHQCQRADRDVSVSGILNKCCIA